MEYTALLGKIIEIGITPALLIVFVLYFLKREGRREEQQEDQLVKRDERWQKELETSNASFKELVNVLLAEGTRREEIMRSEAEKREKIMRQEAEKREAALMRTVDGFSQSTEKICETMDEMKKAFIQMEVRLKNIENKTERWSAGGQA